MRRAAALGDAAVSPQHREVGQGIRADERDVRLAAIAEARDAAP